jgi:hypothetical protein
MRLPMSTTQRLRQARLPQLSNDSGKLSRSPKKTAESTATFTHTTWDNPGCLPHQASDGVSKIFPVELLDKDN